MKLIYPTLFTPFSDGSGGYVVEFPDLPRCISEGTDLISAIEMGIDVAIDWILDELEDGNSIPKASDITKLSVSEGYFFSLLMLDIGSYQEKYGHKAVRKNITIPAWLNTYGESHNINFSKVLQEALFKDVQQCHLLKVVAGSQG